MSKTVHYIGKIKKLNFGDLDANEIKTVLKMRGYEANSWNTLEDIKGVLSVNGEHYGIIEKKELVGGDVFYSEKQGEEIHYRVQYDSNEHTFTEAIEKALDGLEGNE